MLLSLKLWELLVLGPGHSWLVLESNVRYCSVNGAGMASDEVALLSNKYIQGIRPVTQQAWISFTS